LQNCTDSRASGRRASHADHRRCPQGSFRRRRIWADERGAVIDHQRRRLSQASKVRVQPRRIIEAAAEAVLDARLASISTPSVDGLAQTAPHAQHQLDQPRAYNSQIGQGRPVLPMNQDIKGQLQSNFRAGCLAKIG
jgi:hypothetical protein